MMVAGKFGDFDILAAGEGDGGRNEWRFYDPDTQNDFLFGSLRFTFDHCGMRWCRPEFLSLGIVRLIGKHEFIERFFGL